MEVQRPLLSRHSASGTNGTKKDMKVLNDTDICDNSLANARFLNRPWRDRQ
jgi:hypothetical protein